MNQLNKIAVSTSQTSYWAPPPLLWYSSSSISNSTLVHSCILIVKITLLFNWKVHVFNFNGMNHFILITFTIMNSSGQIRKCYIFVTKG